MADQDAKRDPRDPNYDWDNVDEQAEQPQAEERKTPPRPPEQRSVSYRIGDTLIKRFNEYCRVNNVQKSSLAHFLLRHGLDALENGSLQLPGFEPQRPRKLDIKDSAPGSSTSPIDQ